jgi:SAM-dependent methyltransferase
MTDAQRVHWEGVYTRKGEAEVSWFEDAPAVSMALLALTGAAADAAIIDIGGGASRLVDALLDSGHHDLTVLDLSAAALAASRARIGARADSVAWIAADATAWRPERSYDIWHDRAAFHFLTDAERQRAYVDVLRLGLRVGGHAIFGTFAPEGPETCSGLPVARHSAATITARLGEGFTRIDERRHDHRTPWGSVQKFQFSTFRRDG